MNHVEGKKIRDIKLYALSTCIWCRRTKNILNKYELDYYYTDVDLLEGSERSRVEQEISKWNPSISFPTIVIDDKEYIIGYEPQRIKELLGL
ncbi:glutaredoxin family protein [Elusimicrobiota bacterium]